MQHPDAVVVGAGIVGAACTYYLAREGLRVLCLDAAFASAGTTAAGMGHISVMDDSEAQFALTSYSRRLWEELGAEMPRSCEDERCGTLWVAADEEEMQHVRSKAAFYRARAIEVEELSARELAAVEPALRPGLAGALRIPGDRVVYPPNATRWLFAQAIAGKAVLREGCRVERIEPGAVVCGAERITAGIVVNAAGAHAPELTPELPVVPRKGHLVITDRQPGFCHHQLVELGYLKSAHQMTAESVAFNLQPRATGQLLIGSSRELVGWDPSVHRAIVRRMLRRAVEFVPGLARLAAIRTWIGFRPATADKLPLVGRWQPVDGLWIATGHEGLGITTALATGRMLADLVAGRQPAIDPQPFDPMRCYRQAAVS